MSRSVFLWCTIEVGSSDVFGSVGLVPLTVWLCASDFLS